MKTKLNLSKTVVAVLCALALSQAGLFAANAPKTVEEHGIIKSVDANAYQLVVTDQKTKADETFQWNAQTKFTEHHKSMNASSLQPGMRIHLTYDPSAGTPTLKVVELSPAKAEKKLSSSSHSSRPT